MYAVVRSGGKQHRVAQGEKIRVEKLANDVGDNIDLEVLMLGGEGEAKIGAPLVEGASVTAKILRHDKDAKIRVFKKKRRKGYHKTIGHRQWFSEIEIQSIKG